MRAYWEIAVRAFARAGAYRLNALLRIAGALAALAIQVAIWRALLAAGGGGAGASLGEMTTYAVLTTCLGTLQLTWLFRTVDARLRTGDVAIDLVRPLPYPLALGADAAGTVAFQAVATALPTLVVAALTVGLAPPASPVALAGFAAAVLLSLAVSMALGCLVALLAFWCLTTMHFDWALQAAVKVFGGAFLPLWFFPPGLAALAAWLPFRYLSFVPAAVYLGRVPVPELPGTLLLGLGWAVALLGLARWLWGRAVQRLVVQGG